MLKYKIIKKSFQKKLIKEGEIERKKTNSKTISNNNKKNKDKICQIKNFKVDKIKIKKSNFRN
jgi:hypothetical protein